MKTPNNISTGENTGFHFDGEANSFSISQWVRENLNKFNLNEEHSCKVTQFVGDITISGDEDLVLLKVEDLEIINL